MRVLLTSWGSHGDFYPFLALGQTLRQRGHQVTLVGNPAWEESSRQAGLEFQAAFGEKEEDALRRHPEMIDNRWLGLPSLYHLMQKGILPVLPSTFETLLELAPKHDLLVAHHFVFPAGMIHQKTGIPWVTVCLAPGVTPSAWNQPAASWKKAPTHPWERWSLSLDWKIGNYLIRPLVDRPLNRFRKKIGLPFQSDHFFQSRSPDLILHLYSQHFSKKPPDWDRRHRVTGFCHLNSGRDFLVPSELTSFLQAGPPPLLFTLGTTVIEHPREFFREAIGSLENSPHRAILLVGKEENRPVQLSDRVLVLAYAPHDWLMPRCLAVAHQCGVGTTAEALRAGLPTVGCPHAFDQPSNALRLVDLGVGVVLKPHEHRAPLLRRAFAAVLEAGIRERAAALAQRLTEEEGTIQASQALEKYYQEGPGGSKP